MVSKHRMWALFHLKSAGTLFPSSILFLFFASSSRNFSPALICLLSHPVVCWFFPDWFYYTPISGFNFTSISLCPTLVISNFPPNPSNKVVPSGSLNHSCKWSFHQGPTVGKLWWTRIASQLLPPSPSPYSRNLMPPLNTACLLLFPT